jgi:hypothetical protein
VTMLDLGACFCGQPATRTLAAVPYCDPCAEVVLAPIRERHPSNGQQVGPLRPDYGPGWAELGCTTCGATWVGRIGDTCGWCIKALDEPRTSKLRLAPPPDVHLDPGLTWVPLDGNGYADSEPDPDRDLRAMLIDWPAFWAHDHADAEWLAEPLLPAKRSVALFAPGGTGKSLLALWLAVHLAAGRDPFTGRTQPPIDVLYLDYEMTEADLSERLEQMGFGPDHDLTHLHYALLPSLPGLDQPEGGKAVVRLAALVDAALVVVDTFGRAVHGDENDADTVRAWYRWTGLHLKAEGRAFCRVDHAGKDLAKGQRGTSAKNDDVDVVWQMTARDGGFKMAAKKRRMGWVPLEVDIVFTEEPTLTFTLTEDDTWPVGTKEAAAALDEITPVIDISVRAAAKGLRLAGHKARQEVIRAAVKYRKRRSDTFHFVGDERSPGRDDESGNASGNASPPTPSVTPAVTAEEDDLFTQADRLRNASGNAGNKAPPQVGNTVPPLRGHSYPADAKPRQKPDPMEDF